MDGTVRRYTDFAPAGERARGRGSNDNAAVGDDRPRALSPVPIVPGQPQLVELFTHFRDGGAAGFALAQVPAGGQLLWVQDRMVALETGAPFGQSFARFGGDADRLVLACARGASDLLWAMEEGLRCASLSAIIGEVWGDPRSLDFTATKRLAMRAERQGVHVFLIRVQGNANLSAARRRWRVRSLPSRPDPHDDRAPGSPRWHAELFRARDTRPGTWEARYDRAAHRVDLVPPFRDGAVEDAAKRGSGKRGLSLGSAATG